MTREDRTFVEELEVTGQDLVRQVKELVQQSNARRVTIYTEGGEELLSMPLTFGVVAGGLVTLSAPALAGLGALAALVTHVRLKVTRDGSEAGTPAGSPEGEPPGFHTQT